MRVLSRVRVSSKKNKNKEKKKTHLYLVSVLSSRQNKEFAYFLWLFTMFVTTPHVVHRAAVTASLTLLEMQIGALPPSTPNLHSS